MPRGWPRTWTAGTPLSSLPPSGGWPAAPGGGFQLGLFTDTGHGTFRTLEEARAIVDEEFRRRREALATGYGVTDPAAPEPVGCLLLVAAQ